MHFPSTEIGARPRWGFYAEVAVITYKLSDLSAVRAQHDRVRVRSDAASAAPRRQETMVSMIVVAEDDDDIREIILYILRREGYTALGFPDGEAALSQIRRHHPAAVVSDVDMPRMSGFDLCRAIRADPDAAGTPVVLVSGSLLPGDARPFEAGSDVLLTKPFKSRELLDSLSVLMAPDSAGRRRQTAGAAGNSAVGAQGLPGVKKAPGVGGRRAVRAVRGAPPSGPVPG
jgi:CheY-like chemotaxis protein